MRFGDILEAWAEKDSSVCTDDFVEALEREFAGVWDLRAHLANFSRTQIEGLATGCAYVLTRIDEKKREVKNPALYHHLLFLSNDWEGRDNETIKGYVKFAVKNYLKTRVDTLRKASASFSLASLNLPIKYSVTPEALEKEMPNKMSDLLMFFTNITSGVRGFHSDMPNEEYNILVSMLNKVITSQGGLFYATQLCLRPSCPMLLRQIILDEVEKQCKVLEEATFLFHYMVAMPAIHEYENLDLCKFYLRLLKDRVRLTPHYTDVNTLMRREARKESLSPEAQQWLDLTVFRFDVEVDKSQLYQAPSISVVSEDKEASTPPKKLNKYSKFSIKPITEEMEKNYTFHPLDWSPTDWEPKTGPARNR